MVAMNFAMNLEPHIAALLLLGSGALLVLLVLTTPVLVFWRREWLRYTLRAIAVLVFGYGILLLAFSAFSLERTLARGQEKYFCELDCHIAYSVRSVQRMKSIGNATAGGEFYVVTVRSRFDETTIAPWRGDAPLTPNPHDVTLVDDQGRALKASLVGQQAWDAAHGTQASLLQPLRPGEFYEATMVFDVPRDVSSPRALVSSRGFPMPMLIGDESSLLHKKTYFAL
jgi:hypothetical protein